MNDNLTDIVFLLDRTGSMSVIKDDVVGGYNTFLEKQQGADGEAVFTLIQFDSQDYHEVIHDAKPIGDVPVMKPEDYAPRAMTPLLDALGTAVVKTGERLSAMPEDDRPGKVVFVVLTDGYENHSREYTKQQVKDMVTHQHDAYQWQFVFLGVDIDAFAQAGGMGVAAAATASTTRSAVRAAVKLTAENVAQYRTTGDVGSLAYTAEQRDEMADEGGDDDDA